MTSDISYYPLPHGLKMIADVTDAETALTIAMERRGTRMRIPQVADGSVLADIVGIDAARQIVNELADEVIEIPIAQKPLALWLRHDKGWEIRKIANRLGISRRALQKWVNNKPTQQHPDLFDPAA